jgi:hypothetical protein
MPDLKPIKSDTAILDVTKGRKALYRHVGNTPLGTDFPNRIPVTIAGYIVGAWGNDDGVSREFQVNVETVTIGKGKS